MQTKGRAALVGLGAVTVLGLSALLAAMEAGPAAMVTAFASIALLVVLLGERFGHGRDAVRFRTTGFALVTAFVAIFGLLGNFENSGTFWVSAAYLAIAVIAMAVAFVSSKVVVPTSVADRRPPRHPAART